MQASDILKNTKEKAIKESPEEADQLGLSFDEAIEAFTDNSVKSFVEDDIDPRGDKEEYREIYFYNVEDCEIYLPKKYINKIWDEIENKLHEDVKIDEATKAEKLWEINEGR